MAVTSENGNEVWDSVLVEEEKKKKEEEENQEKEW